MMNLALALETKLTSLVDITSLPLLVLDQQQHAREVARLVAMLEIAAASKMRAAALTKDGDRFSISKCIKALDDLQDSSTSNEDFDIELDEMELVAAAAGYLYYQSCVNQPQSNSPPTICTYLKALLEGPVKDCRELLRMDKHVFHKLSETLRGKGLLRDTTGVLVEEQLLYS
ncbi:PREDICTED: uncharacterized protein LOC104772169 [Camelina sativa]|uniref:Uncharacterized protein LOC104772169 n=1 Tax=Camelina sativa TaxID=90675 RepID=A0ABM1RGB4_CAMSA|nr:PREDICTED: uncharacterized protein LOC104772169 [Camelina sativa]